MKPMFWQKPYCEGENKTRLTNGLFLSLSPVVFTRYTTPNWYKVRKGLKLVWASASLSLHSGLN